MIFAAIDVIKNCFGGLEVNLISEKMYRRAPDEFTPLGKLGVDIEINGIKTFLGCESMAEQIMCNPMGQMIAEEFAYTILSENKFEWKKL